MRKITQPWLTEPNEKDFTSHGLPCALRRGPLGAWCGYVGIPRTHRLYHMGYAAKVRLKPSLLHCKIGKRGVFSLLCHSPEDRKQKLISLDMVFNVHGSLTYSDRRVPTRDKPGPSGFWWFGFDCSHFNDLVPGLLTPPELPPELSHLMEKVNKLTGLRRPGIYRTIRYAAAECRSLAKQLAAYKP